MKKAKSKKEANGQGIAQAAASGWRNRIVRQGTEDPRKLIAHPDNWRAHPDRQREALTEVLNQVGWVQAVVVSERTGRILDGHLRVALAIDRNESLVPVTWVDVSEDEELLILSTLDPISAIAKTNRKELRSILDRIGAGREALFEKLKLGGFRTGASHATSRVEQWATAGNFYDVPESVRPVLERTKTLVVQFSGGKDSTSAALWAAKNRGDRALQLVFTDPGVEFPGITAHVAEVAEFLNAEYIIVKPPEDWWSWIRKEGWPSLLFRPCAQTFVHHPFGEHLKKLDPETTLLFTGGRAEEAVRGSTKTATSRLPSHPRAQKFEHFAPCFSAKKAVLEQVIAESGVPLWEGYSRGFVRTACWCCPGQCGLQALALTRVYPGLAEEIRRWEKRVGIIQPHSAGRGGTTGKSFDDLVRAGEGNEGRLKRQNGESTPTPKRRPAGKAHRVPADRSP